MKKFRNLLLTLLSVVCVGTMAVCFAGCKDEETSSSSMNSSNTASSVENSLSVIENSSSVEDNSSDSSNVEEIKTPSEGLKFTLKEDNLSYSVMGIGTCTDTDVVIPATYEGLPVTTIGDWAFSYCSGLKSIEIPDSVTMIGVSAFYNCRSLTSITFEGTIEQWNAIEKNRNWAAGISVTEVVCSDGTVAL